jgi:putative Mg2+ transporter-C (MgtC) family protein
VCTIIKLTNRLEVRGLTTAASIWVAAGIGTAVALKMYYLAVCTAVLAVVLLRGLRLAEEYLEPGAKPPETERTETKRKAK